VKLAIASGKGGTGKTTLSVNLASLLRKNQDEGQVALVDLDVEEPNSGLFFKQSVESGIPITRTVPEWDNDKCTLCGLCKEICNFNAITIIPDHLLIFPELCHSCFACIDLCPELALLQKEREIGTLKHSNDNGLDLIESKLIIGEPSGVPLIAQTKDYIKSKSEPDSTIIYDCPPGNSCPVIESVKDVDFVILVTEPTPFGLSDLIIAIETMKKMNIKFGVVINKALSEKNDVKDYCLQNGIILLGSIMHSRKYAESSSNGELLSATFPEFRNELQNIIKNVQSEINTNRI